eukprot:EG_transcript_29765
MGWNTYQGGQVKDREGYDGYGQKGSEHILNREVLLNITIAQHHDSSLTQYREMHNAVHSEPSGGEGGQRGPYRTHVAPRQPTGCTNGGEGAEWGTSPPCGTRPRAPSHRWAVRPTQLGFLCKTRTERLRQQA